MTDLIIVGSGLFGSYAARLARAAGLSVVVIDDRREMAASRAAAGVFKPSWVRRYGTAGAEGLGVLESFPAFDVPFIRRENGREEVLRCLPPRLVLVEPDFRRTVTQVRPNGRGGVAVLTAGGGEIEARAAYIAAGVWSAALVAPHFDLEISAKAGTTFAFLERPPAVIWSWAPYRQALAFERDPGRTHFSDGTAILERKFDRERHTLATLGRAREVGLTSVVEEHTGLRPYAKWGPAFREVAQSVFVGTGGERSGTVLGAAFAARLLRALGGRL